MRYKVEIEQIKTDGRRLDRNYVIYDEGLSAVVARFGNEKEANDICDRLNKANEALSD